MTGLPQLRARLAARGLDLLRAWPRDGDHLLLHLRPEGTAAQTWVAGQWFRDDARAAAVARATPDGTDGPAAHLPGTGVVLQPGGADRRLATAGLLPAAGRDGAPGRLLVAHRPERRAVLRGTCPATGDGVHTKVVRPSRVAALARSASWQPRGVRVPQVLGVDDRRGAVTTATLPGLPLVDLGPGADPWREAGLAVSALHGADPPAGARPHGVDEELAVAARWLTAAWEHRALGGAEAGALLLRAEAAATALRRDPGPRPAPVPLHRDLHDKQVLVSPAGAGLLDLDLVAVGDPALDVANLLVHLHLRDLQAEAAGRATAPAAAARAEGFLAGYGGPPPGTARLRAWAELAAVRVAAVYAFRAAGTPAVTFTTATATATATATTAATAAVADRDDVGGAALGERLLSRLDEGLPGLPVGAAGDGAGPPDR